MKLIYVEPAEYFTPSMRKILEAGETETTLKGFIPSEIKNIANQNPEDVANVLRSWLGE